MSPTRIARLASWLDLPGSPGGAFRAHDLAAEAEVGGLTSLLDDLLLRLERARERSRRQGWGCFVPTHRGLEDGGDVWLDDIAQLHLDEVFDAALGAHLRAGGAARDVVPWLDAFRHAVEASHAAAHAHLRRPVAVTERFALWSRAALPIAVPGDQPVIDTRELSDHLEGALLAAAADAPVRVWHGQNRDVLRHLEATERRIDAVIQDPPYATGKRDLPYRDCWPEGAWSAMMREHLVAVRDRLHPGGVAVLQIDEHRGAELSRVAQDAFGAGFLGMSVWDKRNPKGDARGIAMCHELIVWGTSSRGAMRARGGLRRPKRNARRMLDKAASLVARHGVDQARDAYRAWVKSQSDLTGGERAYCHIDAQGRVYRPVSMAWPNRTLPPEAYFRPLVHPVTGEACPVPARGWRNTPDTMERLMSEGRILFGEDHTTQPTRKYLLADMRDERLPSVLHHGGSDDKKLKQMSLRFPHAKPTALLHDLIYAAAPSTDAIVADFFAGSGSTAHAVAELNHQDGARREVWLAEASPRILQEQLLPRLRALLRAIRWDGGVPSGPAAFPCVLVEVLRPV